MKDKQAPQIHEKMVRISKHSGVNLKKIDDSKYLVSFEGKSWHVWPRSARYIEVVNGKQSGDLFYAEPAFFYGRCIAKNIHVPENFGKKWTDGEEKSVFEMIEFGHSINQIAIELARHPVSVHAKICQLLEIDQRSISQDSFDVAVNELLNERLNADQ